jgi:hypothetical protein
MCGSAGSGGAGLNGKRAEVSITNPARSIAVACQVASTGKPRPEGRVGEPLKARLPRLLGNYVLVEAQLPVRPNHAKQLRERSRLIGHGAENQRGHPSVERCLIAR